MTLEAILEAANRVRPVKVASPVELLENFMRTQGSPPPDWWIVLPISLQDPFETYPLWVRFNKEVPEDAFYLVPVASHLKEALGLGMFFEAEGQQDGRS